MQNLLFLSLSFKSFNMNDLKQFGVIPVDIKTISSLLAQYKSPVDKVSRLEKDGHLIRLKKGLYVVSPELSNLPISKELIANQLYGPSYISLESALSFYGLIPERVYMVLSVTSKRKKIYITPLGEFDFVKVPDKYYSIGIVQKVIENSYAYLIASPEKALCDIITTKSGIRIQSLKALKNLLLDDLRIDFSINKKWDVSIVNECIKYGYKKSELQLLSKFIGDECSI